MLLCGLPLPLGEPASALHADAAPALGPDSDIHWLLSVGAWQREIFILGGYSHGDVDGRRRQIGYLTAPVRARAAAVAFAPSEDRERSQCDAMV